MTGADDHSSSAFASGGDTGARPFQPGGLGQVVGVPTHSPPPPLTVREGDEVTAVGYDERWPGFVLCGLVNGQTGWLPEGVLGYVGPGMGVARTHYAGAVLTAAIGDVLTLHEQANGWYWATGPDGRAGWVLAAYVQPLEED